MEDSTTVIVGLGVVGALGLGFYVISNVMRAMNPFNAAQAGGGLVASGASSVWHGGTSAVSDVYHAGGTVLHDAGSAAKGAFNALNPFDGGVDGELDYNNAVALADTSESTADGFEILKDGGGNEYVVMTKPPTNEEETFEGMPILMPIHEVQLGNDAWMYVLRDVYGTIYTLK
jgi:hypothetical protein